MLRFCVTLLFGLGLIYGALVMVASITQRNLQYFPTHVDRKGAGNSTFRPWRDVAGQFWGYIRPSEDPKRVVIFFHGNGGEALGRNWLDELIPDTRVLLLLAEYPGFGARAGDPSEALIFQEAELLFDTVRQKWALLPITIVGESLGSGPASYIANKRDIDRLALISPFSSAVDVGQFHYPYLPVRWIMKDRYENMRYLAATPVPLHIVQGESDEVVPIQFGEKLFEAYTGPKTFTRLPGYGHNDIVPALIKGEKTKAFRDFLVGR
ncbi:MAG: alpha/beta hydrolase [Bdellovibrionaceae bacterium]|nr:alpha/beta hydrolase [Pseudobdellovibrionaceae bacterium]